MQTYTEGGVTGGGMRRRVVVIDQLPLMRHAIGTVLGAESELMYAGESGNAGESVALVAKTAADVVVTDLVFEHCGGFELVRHLRARYQKLAIVIHSGQSFPACVRHSIRL